MATEKNITMKQFNGTDYDTLYPKTKVEQVEGAYTQQQILADSTKALFGLSNDAVPDDVFSLLGNYIPSPFGLLIVRVSDSNGNGVPAKINVSPSVGAVSTFFVSDRGFYSILCEPGIYTLTPSEAYPFTTVSTGAQQVTVKEGIPIVVDFSATKNEHGEYDYTESDEVLVPNFVTDLDLFVVGGGASGSISATSSAGGSYGGGGGYTNTLLNQNLANKLLKIIVGSGGVPATLEITSSDSPTAKTANPGGKTSVSVNGSEILVANGGNGNKGGSGGGHGKVIIGNPMTIIKGNGGSDGSNGENGGTGQGTTTRKFGESGNTLYASGGGGSCYHKVAGTAHKGAGTAGPGGGDGTVIATISKTGTYTGKSATTLGSGGGGLKIGGTSGTEVYPITLRSGAGAPGMVSLRW